MISSPMPIEKSNIGSADLMEKFRTEPPADIAGYKVLGVKDYEKGVGELPRSNVLEFNMEQDVNVLVRPSGTERTSQFPVVAAQIDERRKVLFYTIIIPDKGFPV